MFYTILFLILSYYILTQSELSLHYAFFGFTLWYRKMLPSLLPFMILSGILVRMNLSVYFAGILHPVLKRLFHCSKEMSYGIIIGFLCGFPMGARVTADLYKTGKISHREAEFLLSFCNNIGPVYFCTFVIPLLGLPKMLPFLIGMYGLPLLYGFVLRNTVYKDLKDTSVKETSVSLKKAQPLLTAVDESIEAAVKSILMLCGYMILFNLFHILPHFWLPGLHKYIAPILEITGGLSILGKQAPFYSLCLLPFGGLSCIAQTNSMIVDTDLSIRKYILHKVILTFFTILYYLILFFFL